MRDDRQVQTNDFSLPIDSYTVDRLLDRLVPQSRIPRLHLLGWAIRVRVLLRLCDVLRIYVLPIPVPTDVSPRADWLDDPFPGEFVASLPPTLIVP